MYKYSFLGTKSIKVSRKELLLLVDKIKLLALYL